MMSPFKFAVMIFISLVIAILLFNVNYSYAKNTESNCVIQKIYTPDKETLLETTMVCRDGNVGPSYWELFAEFYYAGVSEQEYCRYVKGKLLPKKVCLNPDGTWRYND